MGPLQPVAAAAQASLHRLLPSLLRPHRRLMHSLPALVAAAAPWSAPAAAVGPLQPVAAAAQASLRWMLPW